MIKSKTDKKLIVFSLILICIFCSLVVLIQTNSPILSTFDNVCFSFTKALRCEPLTVFTYLICFFADEIVVFILLIILLLIPSRKEIGFPCAVILSVANLLGFITKIIVKRLRPIENLATSKIFDINLPESFSFPSGHSLNSLLFYFILCYLILKKHNKLKHIYLGFIPAIVVGFSRVYLGVHFTSDVLGGYILGAIFVLVFLYLLEHNTFGKIYNSAIKKRSILTNTNEDNY